MQVVILAAGRGDRFASAGYTQMKPLIPVNGHAMIWYALRQAMAVSLGTEIHEAIVLCPQSIRHDVWTEAPEDCVPKIIGVQHTQRGAAMTLLAAAAVLDEDQPVLVMDCDSIIDPALIKAFVAHAEAHFTHPLSSTVSMVLTFKPTDGSARYSFVEYEGQEVTRIVEKQPISDMATCGVHVFKTWSRLRAAIAAMVFYDNSTNGEFYLAPVHSYMLRMGDVLLHEIPEKEFHVVGTPEQLEAYEQAVSKA
jgi:dTDP-glucose pyrophosphorylase